MKTVTRLIRRCIAAAFCIVLLVFAVNAALVLALIVRVGTQGAHYPVGLHRLSDSFAQQEDGSVAPDPALADSAFSGAGYAWAMLLDHQGQLLWQHALPPKLDHPYTVGQVAAFSRWYLDDYPVFVSRNAYGLLVMGMPPDSFTRFDLYLDNRMLRAMLNGFFPLLVLDAALILASCLLLGLAAARGLRAVAQGIDMLAQGEAVCLPERGMAGELAEKLNRTSRRLSEQSEAISRRDSARTEWIAGVSHDIRTPLALILGHAEQLAADPAASPDQRRRSGVIAAQCADIRALIEDLNLTSKLQYGAQPLRVQPVAVGALVRGCVSDFLNSGQSGACTVLVDLPPEAGQATLPTDAALLSRALRNLLVNSVRHNPGGCTIHVRAAVQGGSVALCVRDDGCGYPPAVLRVLTGGAPEDAGTHILCLHLVAQIVRAHGGCVRFVNDGGACCTMAFDMPCQEHV